MTLIARLGGLIFWLVLGALAGGVLYRPVTGLLTAAGAVRRNYAGREVPVGGGLVFVLAGLAVGTVQWAALVLWAQTPGQLALPLALFVAILGFCLLGLIDDVLGSRETGGFKGHFRLLFKEGRLTSGVVKALGGLLVAAFPAAVTLAGEGAARGLVRLAGEGMLNAVIIGLCANAVNLLDLRPGRAFKGFALLLAAGVAASPGHSIWAWLAPLTGAATVFARHDLRAEAMMGDTGANVLGAAVGIGVAWSGSATVRLVWMASLILFHLYTERTSLSARIEQVALLRWFDRLGRSREREAGRE